MGQKRAPLGLNQRDTKKKNVKFGLHNVGRYWQVVVIRRWSLTEVWLYFVNNNNNNIIHNNFNFSNYAVLNVEERGKNALNFWS